MRYDICKSEVARDLSERIAEIVGNLAAKAAADYFNDVVDNDAVFCHYFSDKHDLTEKAIKNIVGPKSYLSKYIKKKVDRYIHYNLLLDLDSAQSSQQKLYSMRDIGVEIFNIIYDDHSRLLATDVICGIADILDANSSKKFNRMFVEDEPLITSSDIDKLKISGNEPLSKDQLITLVRNKLHFFIEKYSVR